ncbi:hypothetical protein BTW10_11595 [Chromohalobacter japonicus]|uniref:Phage head morphogenesis domain-containing protein n=1 Tax=Chromohalobacter japonicus TaxID=223900 RepID=A0A1Q8TBQ4_9GAMM|nr:hypothetical protein BTW10_11595 [Chromohalobacter japonicus]
MTDAVLVDLKENIRVLPEVDTDDFEAIYQAALRAISAGGALHIISAALMGIDGMTKGRAADISRSLNLKTKAIMNAEQQTKLGIKYATWCYSGAPCRLHPKLPGGEEQDAAHKAADGKPYLISRGMFLNSEWTWPGRQDGCKCISKAMIPGLDGYDGGKPKGLVE